MHAPLLRYLARWRSLALRSGFALQLWPTSRWQQLTNTATNTDAVTYRRIKAVCSAEATASTVQTHTSSFVADVRHNFNNTVQYSDVDEAAGIQGRCT
jgi:hypothetical protein